MASSASNYDVAVGVRPGADGHDDSDKGKDGRKAGPADGAARGNPGPGGYGAVLEYIDPKNQLHVKELSAGYRRTTNNRMELLGVITALEALNRPCNVTLYSDSKYVVDAFNQHWVDGWVRKGLQEVPYQDRHRP